MENLPTEVIDKIIDFKNGDNKYWKNEYNKVINEILNNGDLKCKRRLTHSINAVRHCLANLRWINEINHLKKIYSDY